MGEFKPWIGSGTTFLVDVYTEYQKGAFFSALPYTTGCFQWTGGGNTQTVEVSLNLGVVVSN